MLSPRSLRLGLLICSVCLTLFCCELIVRYILRASPFERAVVAPSYLSARERPLRWRYSASNGRNSLGLLNREVGPKEPGSYRILFLGDSLIAMGDTTSGELYTQVLERGLNARFANPSNSVEVINAGIPGYTTYQELEFLKIHGLDMQPDMVVLGFVFNDVFYKYLHKPTSENLLDREPTTHLHGFNTETFPGTLFARSYLAHEVVRRSQLLWKRLRGRPTFPFEENSDVYLAWKEYGWTDVRRLIREMHALLTERNIFLAIVVFPIREQVDDQYRTLDEAYVLYPQSKVREISGDDSIPLVDLTESLHRQGGEALFRDYVHLNGKGNDVVAEELDKYLARQLAGRLPVLK